MLVDVIQILINYYLFGINHLVDQDMFVRAYYKILEDALMDAHTV
jgi:hypothetical protein